MQDNLLEIKKMFASMFKELVDIKHEVGNTRMEIEQLVKLLADGYIGPINHAIGEKPSIEEILKKYTNQNENKQTIFGFEI